MRDPILGTRVGSSSEMMLGLDPLLVADAAAAIPGRMSVVS